MTMSGVDGPRRTAPRGRRRAAHTETAARLLSPLQKVLGIVLAAMIAAGGFLWPRPTATLLVGFCIFFYVLLAGLRLVIMAVGRAYRPPRRVTVRAEDPGLPDYAVLLPVHKEANMLRHLVTRINKLEYPRQRLHVLLLIESDDEETLAAAREIGLQFDTDPQGGDGFGSGFAGAASPAPSAHPLSHVTVVVIPPGGPKTKPNAMNVAMRKVTDLGCTFLTIFDAEDRPEPDQLLKAIGTFRLAPPELVCLQAELAFWNDDTNWVSALYWIAYKIHFVRFLPGLAKLGLPIPLGGTSNHFKVSALRDAALPDGSVWDAHNLTEDADLGARLISAGYRIQLLTSVTLEEAPVNSRVVDKQQRRWKGGYLQTGLVHTRHPLRAIRRMGLVRWFCFNLLMLGTPFSFMINPVFYALTLTYFVTRTHVITELFPTVIYYPSLALLVVGNFVLVFELILTCLEEANSTRGRYSLLWYMMLAPLMWLWMSYSTYVATWELLTGKRGWHKTPHGHTLDDAELDSGLFADAAPGRPPAPQFPLTASGVAEGETL
jgi:cellulose synthase/poly-beta-1,6-N-acetylglucosamine synthase-like glycosyltransferase